VVFFAIGILVHLLAVPDSIRSESASTRIGSASPQKTPDQIHHLIQVERLAEKVIDGQLAAKTLRFRIVEGRHYDHVAGIPPVPLVLEKVETATVRELHIQDQKIDLASVIFQNGLAVLGRTGREDVVPRIPEGIRERLEEQRLVVHN
jgi:hypothetical protein